MRTSLAILLGLLLAACGTASPAPEPGQIPGTMRTTTSASTLTPSITLTPALTDEYWYGMTATAFAGREPGMIAPTPSAPPSNSPVSDRVSAPILVAGMSHTCVVTAGAVKCWGFNGSGQLGIEGRLYSTTAVEVPELAGGATALAAGESHTCVLMQSGGVKCWGRGFSALEDVTGLESGVQFITAGASHTCALTAAGGVKCWGSNRYGQLGDGSDQDRAEPVDVSGLTSGVASIAAGPSHTCALTDQGKVMCWGNNQSSELGIVEARSSPLPVEIVGLPGRANAIFALRYGACARTDGYGTWCWGASLSTLTGKYSPTPQNAELLAPDVIAMEGGGSTVCELTAAGTVKCWGWNGRGLLGTGDERDVKVPTAVKGLTGTATAMAAGNDYICAMVEENVQCWGVNTWGELGNDTLTRSPVPVVVRGITDTVPRVFTPPNFTVDKDAHCRMGPNTLYDIVTSLPLGTPVEIKGRDRDWWLVRVRGSGYLCWVAGSTGAASGSIETALIVAAPPLPGFPYGMRAAVVCKKGGKERRVDLEWNDQEGETGFLLYRNDKLIATLPADTRTFHDTLVRMEGFSYRIVAFNQYGKSIGDGVRVPECKPK